MSDRFEWREVETLYREQRTGGERDELRWIINRETIRDTVTGQTVTRAIIRHPGICVMVPFTDDDRIVLVRQYRHPVDGELWELPAGTLDGREEGSRVVRTETPEACAARELREETGYEAAHWEKIAECYAMPGGNDHLIHVFIARGLAPGRQALDPGEMISEVRAFTADELTGMVARGDIRDAKTLVGLFHALGRRPGGVRLP
jgi:ADP-ribose pyrophosphatase